MHFYGFHKVKIDSSTPNHRRQAARARDTTTKTIEVNQSHRKALQPQTTEVNAGDPGHSVHSGTPFASLWFSSKVVIHSNPVQGSPSGTPFTCMAFQQLRVVNPPGRATAPHA